MKNLFYTSPKYLQNLKGLDSSASEIDGSVKCHPQLQKFESKLVEGIDNLKVFITSDSTGNSNTEWTYNLTEWIADNYSKYTTYWYEWDTQNNNAYKTPISFGTGDMRCDVFSYGIGGSRLDHLYNTFEISVEGIIDTALYPNTSSNVDLIICNHGQNYLDTETVENLECRYADAIELLLQNFPDAGVVLFLQNPRQTNTDRWTSRTAVVNYASRRSFAIANAYELFMARNKDESLYEDFVHPNSAGQALFLEAITKLIRNARFTKSISNVSLFNITSINIYRNSIFSNWSNVNLSPDNITTAGLINSKDTTNYYDRTRAYSWKIATNGVANYIQISPINANTTRAKGQWVTFGMKYKYNSGSTTPGGGLVMQFGNNPVSLSYGLSFNPNRWFYKTWCCYIKPSEDLKITLYPDGSLSNGYSINIDSIFITLGKNSYY